jgi:hypothetical protein
MRGALYVCVCVGGAAGNRTLAVVDPAVLLLCLACSHARGVWRPRDSPSQHSDKGGRAALQRWQAAAPTHAQWHRIPPHCLWRTMLHKHMQDMAAFGYADGSSRDQSSSVPMKI